MNTNTYPDFLPLARLVNDPALSQRTRMDRALVRLARWRQKLLVNTYRVHHGHAIFSGPFAGMTYSQATEGATLPRLIGCYEAELQPHLLQLATSGYKNVIDIGCAEGYYAVGLARLLPDVQVFAYDIDVAAQKACLDLAHKNNVQARVHIGGHFDANELQRHVSEKTLVFCDIEGAEEQLLNPEQYPAFKEADLIVEVHECFRRGLVDQLHERFHASHEIEWIWQSPNATRKLPDWVRNLSHLDQILCTWEWRAGPTPWAVMRKRDH